MPISSNMASRAAHISWARTPNRSARTAPAREALIKKFQDQADPDGVMSEADRIVAGEHLRVAWYRGLSERARRAKLAKASEKAGAQS